MSTHIWLRAETKPLEHRAALTPATAKELLSTGQFTVSVEKSDQSTFDAAEYEGCTVVDKGSWRSAPKDAYILGLKELPENDDTPLPHTHIMFAHCYKRQAGWTDVLGRFVAGKGLLLDLEFLNDEKGRRVAAFGYHAGFAGTALAVDLWAHQQLSPNEPYPAVKPHPTEASLISAVKGKLDRAVANAGRYPEIMIMGALGRCGSGATDCARKVGIPAESIIGWDLKETQNNPGPYKELLAHDIFVNSIYLSKPIPPFITREMLDGERKLSVICDVSCDTTNPHNPLPVYDRTTTFDDPTIRVETKSSVPLDVIAIDHLPTLLPRESSEQFVSDLLPTLKQLPNRQSAQVWTQAAELFETKVKEMEAELANGKL
ncbi:saccharopine dehydrogenase [Hyaloraphidium curvatum]|nr:saccharopine dehydrogenase [Hyaloraphidium curvatum]